jgi:hypothetical protein
MRLILSSLTIAAILLLSSCSKDQTIETVSLEEKTIYFENFAINNSWSALPSNSVFTPGSNCVRVADGMLKLSFDQTMLNCGCAWVGATSQPTVFIDSTLEDIGVRVQLSKGFFQSISVYRDTVDQYGNPVQHGATFSHSRLTLDFNAVNIIFPNPYNGRVNFDAVIHEDFNRLEGSLFEVTYRNGEKQLTIDGISFDPDLVYINYSNRQNHPLDLSFDLGHQPELSPRLDELYIDQIEIFTWAPE